MAHSRRFGARAYCPSAVRVHLIDPSAYTPPYDDALARALARAGAEVELYTSSFAHGRAPQPQGYVLREHFYRRSARLAHAGARRAAKLAEHVPDMLRYRRAAARAQVAHFQWLPVQALDGLLLPRRREGGPALVLTAHDVLPREPHPGQRAAQRRLYRRFDAVVSHTRSGAARLRELGVEPARVHVIPHGPLAPWEDLPPAGVPAELQDDGRPVVLFFGLLRPYKGIEDLLAAWRGIEDAQLWIVGMPRMDVGALRRSAPPGVQWATRFVSDAEMGALMARAGLLVAPYREAEQSGVALAALGAGVPLLLSDVGGFPEIAAAGAARTFAAGDRGALGAALRELLADEQGRGAMAAAARALAAGEWSWERVAEATLALYDGLAGGAAGPGASGDAR